MNAIENKVNTIIRDISGVDAQDIDRDELLFSLGMDSLMITQIRRSIKKYFDLDISLNQFLMELTTINKIMEYICENVDESENNHGDKITEDNLNQNKSASNSFDGNTENQLFPKSDESMKPDGSGVIMEPSRIYINSKDTHPSSTSIQFSSNSVEQLMSRQLEVLCHFGKEQLNLLKQFISGNTISESFVVDQNKLTNNEKTNANIISKKLDLEKLKEPKDKKINTKGPISFNKKAKTVSSGFNETQEKFLNNLIKTLNIKTKKSKEIAIKQRGVLSDSRATVGFSLQTKELLYPIVGKKSFGSRIVDIDDNEYIDFTMGFGVNIFGHNPPHFNRVISNLTAEDLQLGPRTEVAGEVATLMNEFTGHERFAFTNSGTEAVMVALRLARAATGRDKIVIFNGSYHGHSDGTLALPAIMDGEIKSVPVSDGIPQSVVDNIIALPYDDPESLKIIEQRASEIATVIVEPVQSRQPELQPKEFLHELKDVTKRNDIILTFDEMITGFRIHPKGAQGYFGVDADLCTYGKIVGGGMPIGVVGGSSRLLDHIDGGQWQYGDQSFPAVDRVFFGGTFCQHPLAMLTAKATLEELKKLGPNLQTELNNRTTRMANEMNSYFEEMGSTLKIVNCGSLFHFKALGSLDMLFYQLLSRNIYVWEWRNMFLSTAHTENDIREFITKVKESVRELEKSGFSFCMKGGPKKNNDLHPIIKSFKNKFGDNALPLSSNQKYYYKIDSFLIDKSALHVHEVAKVSSSFDVNKAKKCMEQLVDRHETLRTSFVEKDDEIVQRVHTNAKLHVVEAEGDLDEVNDILSRYLEPFNLDTPPLLQFIIYKTKKKSEYFIIMVLHYIIADKFSANLLTQEFIELYQGRKLKNAVTQYNEFLKWELNYHESIDFKNAKEFWTKKLNNLAPKTVISNIKVKRNILKMNIDNDDVKALKALSKETSSSLFMVLLGAYRIWLNNLTHKDDLVTGIEVSIRPEESFEETVGRFTNTILIRNSINPKTTIKEYFNSIKIDCLQAYAHQDYTYGIIYSDYQSSKNKNQILFDSLFTYDSIHNQSMQIGDLSYTPIIHSYNKNINPMRVEVYETSNRIFVHFIYDSELYNNKEMQKSINDFSYILKFITGDSDSFLQNIIVNQELVK